jgi:Mrp family chromosome partitioning ATPase
VSGLEQRKVEISASLALALASTGNARVLLIEADLDAPRQHLLMRSEMPAGAAFSRQLQIRATRLEPWTVLRATRSLHLLLDEPGGTRGLILLRPFEDCVRSLRDEYDFIVVDGPPGFRKPECSALDRTIDGLVVVADPSQAEIANVLGCFSEKRFSRALLTLPA